MLQQKALSGSNWRPPILISAMTPKVALCWKAFWTTILNHSGPMRHCVKLLAKPTVRNAQRLLINCPESLRNSPVIHLLTGETLFHAGQYHDAESHYLGYLDSHGQDEAISLALAKTFEALGSKEKAQKQYSEIINRCQGCGSRIDPLIKQKYADISLETGDHSTNILELYLGLVQEIPENRMDYYQKISMIYELNGNEEEARRFSSFAEQSRGKPPESE